MRDRWTDERLDDLNAKVDDGFRRVDERFDKVDQRFEKVDQRFDKVDQRFNEQSAWMREEFGRINARIDSLSHSIMYGTFALSAAIIGGFITLS